jgi:hypothetical protein
MIPASCISPSNLNQPVLVETSILFLLQSVDGRNAAFPAKLEEP